MLGFPMSSMSPTSPPAELIAQLAGLDHEPARQDFLHQNPELRQQSVVLRITEEVVKVAREDVARAEKLCDVAAWLSEILNDDFCRARTLRACGHVLHLEAKHNEALESYQRALALFHRQRQEIEEGITLSGSLQPLIYLGRYDEAFEWAQKAREIFKRHGDLLRLARLDANLANILHRQDRFSDALVLYERARQALERLGQHNDVAIVLANMAVCSISLNDFPSALEAHQRGRAYCEQHRMPHLVAQADYNIAYLYYLRGEYTRAIELYRVTRESCERMGDAYHRALCNLDQAEIYLELNLIEEGAELAQQAYASFEDLKMGYEAAKSLALLAVAAQQQRKPFRALELFAKARERFSAERNWIWPALIDLYQALILYHEGRAYEARRCGDAAQNYFSHSSLTGKAAVTELLRAVLHLEADEQTQAQYWCDAAMQRVENAHSPALAYLAFFVLGQIQEARKDPDAAHRSYRQALEALESLPGRRPVEELKIPFVKNKLAVYEALLATSPAAQGVPSSRESCEEAFETIEKAKSRQLADLIAFRASALPAPAGSHSGLAEQVKDLREELNWYYRQVNLRELREGMRSPEQVESLRKHIRERETSLLKTLEELQAPDAEFLSLQNAGTAALERIREALPEDAVLIEYCQAREMIFVCVLDRTHLHVVPLTPASRVRNLLRLLQSQFSKFRLGVEYARAFAGPIKEASLLHLHELHAELLAPVRKEIAGRHLIIAPHGFLHYLPFHALFDGERFLIEDFTVSYSSSASLFHLCRTKRGSYADRAVVMGIPDGQTDQVAHETAAVAAELPGALVLLGEQAGGQALRERAAGSRYVHLSTQAVFRQDNPLFSSLRLGDSQLSFFDLYQLRLPCQLMTLSGCSPVWSPAGNGEELFGLVRGLLYAGAESVALSLWSGAEDSATAFLSLFYRHLKAQPDRAGALRRAMLELRQTYPHPYHWAPYALNGNPGA